MANRFIYLDHNATTPLSPEVLANVPAWLEAWGNPSSIHLGSRAPKNILRESRKAISGFLNCHPLELIFTSGGTESNNTVIQGTFSQLYPKKKRFICSEVEHPSVIKAMKSLCELGAELITIPVNKAGQLDIEFYKKAVNEDTALVSIMAANNETGTIFPTQELAQIAHQAGALFHVDAVQALGKQLVNLKDLDVDYASFSGHKWNALKGSGLLYVKKGSPFRALLSGGSQERARRSGTENVLAIASLGEVFQRWSKIPEEIERLSQLRNSFETQVISKIPKVSITAHETPRLCNTSSLVIDDVDGETLLMSLDLKGFAVSTGAACSSGSPEPSPVLLAMGLTRKQAQNSLRVSFGWMTTPEEVDLFIQTLETVCIHLRSINNGDLNHG